MKTYNTADKKLIKKINTNAILNEVRKNGPISRAAVAKALSLNPATVSSNVNDLLEAKLIEEIGSGDSSGGRRPILLKISSKHNYVIGVHTELTHVNVGIMNLDGDIIIKQALGYRYLGSRLDENHIINTIIQAIDGIIQKTSIDAKKILGIGLGLHGLVDPEKGKSIFAPAFNWHNIDIKKKLGKTFEMNILLDNDVRVMALGEKWFGTATKSENFVLLNLGEGIGGALVINNQLYLGSTFGAGEIGHVKVTSRPILCKCGNHGCLTTVASEEGLTDRMKDIINETGKSVYKIKSIEEVSLDRIYEAALHKDETAIRLLKETGNYIGRGIGLLINILNPERVILTGTVLKAKNFLIDSINDAALSTSIADNYKSTKITISSIDELGIIGAATLIINDLFMGMNHSID